ncbi:WXG100 family type VII secretion target [Curtobacterium sp. YC1]|uniref:WXG100 family type VII secretion target n=1 Tax=Curtobacterium sp. YC1 TaxID=2795488 RepID=UPI002FCD9FAC
MGRPSGWDVVDQGDDPVKGDPSTLRMMAREYQRISDAADDASTRLQSVQGSGWLTDWEGEAADVFVDAIEDTPSDLTKLVDSYELAATALSGWADTVDDTQYRADGALADAKDATGDLAAAQDRLADAQSTLSHYQSASKDLAKVADEYPAGSDVPDGVEVPSPAQLRAASDNASVAQGSVSSAQGDIAAAQSRIDAAKRLVADAKGDWEDAERRTATKIGEAADAGLGKQSTWDKIFGSEAWETIVSIAKVVVAVGGIIVMIIGGPLAWIVLGAALLVLADTLYKMSKGTADGWDLAFALLDCIPGMKGITTAAKIGEEFAKGASLAAKFSAAGRHVASESRQLFAPGLHLVNNLRHGAALRSVESLRALAVHGGSAAVGSLRRPGDGFIASIRSMPEIANKATQAYWDNGGSSLAELARHWQGGKGGFRSGYLGVDRWANGDADSLVGQTLQISGPGHGNFYVPDGTMHAGGSASDYSESVQVGVQSHAGHDGVPAGAQTHPDYRNTGDSYLVNQPLPHAEGIAQANTQFGGGGQHQLFTDKSTNALVNAGVLSPVDQAGNVVPDGMNQVLMDPATRSPQPGVLTTHQYANALQDLGSRGPVVAAGIVTAPWDISEATQSVQDRLR